VTANSRCSSFVSSILLWLISVEAWTSGKKSSRRRWLRDGVGDVWKK
jgi:hypothetical protein